MSSTNKFIIIIKVLGQSLKRLDGVVRRYENQDSHREWHNDARNVWLQLTVDFCLTLQECDELLTRNGYLRSGRTNVAFNLRWWLSAEGAVDNQMAKLRFHIIKVGFYTDPAVLDSIVGTRNETQLLRRDVARLERLLTSGPEQVPNVVGKCRLK